MVGVSLAYIACFLRSQSTSALLLFVDALYCLADVVNKPVRSVGMLQIGDSTNSGAIPHR